MISIQKNPNNHKDTFAKEIPLAKNLGQAKLQIRENFHRKVALLVKMGNDILKKYDEELDAQQVRISKKDMVCLNS